MTIPKSRIIAPAVPVSSAPGTVLIETDRLIIRRYKFSDAQALATAANHEPVAVNLSDGFPHPYTAADAEGFLAGDGLADKNGYPTHAAIFTKDHRDSEAEVELIGAIGVFPGDDVEYRTWEISYWLTPTAWGKGYMTEALLAYTRWILATWEGVNRLESLIFANNGQSCKVLEKCGFVREGCKREAIEKQRKLLDLVVYGLTRRDLLIE